MKEVSDDKQLGRLTLMHRNALRLLNLVNQLLDFRKSEVAGLHLTPAEGDIVAFVRHICASFLMLSEKKNIHLTFYSAVESLNMLFDEDKMGKVVMNLLSNAFKFTPEGGRVDVSMEVLKGEPDKLLLKVSDTGTGIKDEDKEHIFERFYQVDHPDPNLQSTGSGIGLSLVHDFVTLHEGTVQVLDNVGAGSVFLVTIPIKQVGREGAVSESGRKKEAEKVFVESEIEQALDEENEALSDDMDDTTDGGDKEQPLVLVVDDSDDLVAFMKDSLSLYFRIQTASNGREAWRLIPDLQPDIIVSDVMMPEMDGNELCRWVKTDKRTENIPVILLTAKQAVEDKVESLTIGADDYVEKPFNPLELVARVKSQLRRYTQLGNAAESGDSIYTVGGLSINDDLKEVTVDGEVVKLTPIEYNILLLLVKNQGKVFSINQIYESIWNEDAIGSDNTVAVHIRHIREKIEINPKEPRYLKVVWGVGYKIDKN